MKKFLFMGAIAAMLLGTASCSNEVDQPAMGDEVNAAFSVSMDGIESRTISDGLTVNELYFEVYEAKTQGEGESATTTYTKLPSLSQKVDVANKTATVTTKLIKGKTYKFAFWAQKDGAYVATDLQNIQMNYANANANDENRDAFFANVEKTVTAAFEEPVTLYRPFAQINFGASDVDALMDISGFTSQLEVKNVPNQFNVLNGEATGGQDVTVTLQPTAVPAVWTPNKEKLTVDGKDYTYISMNYILATPEKATKDITLKVMDGETEVKKLPVAACPMQRNYRTNILGDILSVEGKFNITIDPIYAGDLAPEKAWDGTLSEPADITGDIIEIKDGSELAWVMNSITNGSALAGKTFKLTNDINLGNVAWPTVNAKCAFTLDGNNKTIKGLKSTGGNYGGLIGKANGLAIVIKDLTIANSEIDASGRTGNDNAAGVFVGWCETHNNATINIQNCQSVNNKLGKAQYNGGIAGWTSYVSITNCTVSNCEIISDYDESGNYKGHSGGVVGYGNDNTAITSTRIADTQITGRNDQGRVGIFYGTAQASVTIGTGNSVKNVTILGTPATSANLVGAVDARTDKSNDNTVTFE